VHDSLRIRIERIAAREIVQRAEPFESHGSLNSSMQPHLGFRRHLAMSCATPSLAW
jgi:hypothetical protein